MRIPGWRLSVALALAALLATPASVIPALSSDGGYQGPCPRESAGGRSQASVWGFVTEKGGAPVLGANVTLYNFGSWLYYTTTSLSSGHYSLTPAPAQYTFKVTKSGYFDFSTNVYVRPGQELRYDINITKIPPVNSKISGTVRNIDTSFPVGLAGITLYDLINNNTITAFAGLLGNYNLDVYEGTFMIIGWAYNYLTKCTGGVAVRPNQTVTLNIELYPAPPLDATVHGQVRDAAGNPLSGAGILFYDEEKHFFTNVTTGANGLYSIDLYKGNFVLVADDPNSTQADNPIVNVSTMAGNVTQDFQLQPLPVSLALSTVDLRDLASGSLTINLTTWGKGLLLGGLSVTLLRFVIDIYNGNGDLYTSPSEYDYWRDYIRTLLRNNLQLYDSKLLFRLDGMDYQFDRDFIALDIDLEGSAFSNAPLTIDLSLNAHSNGTVDAKAPSHNVWLNKTYSTINDTNLLRLDFPDFFTVRNQTAPQGFALNLTGNLTISIDPPQDPAPDDNIVSVPITFTLADRLPPLADAGFNKTVNQFSLVELNATASSDNLGISSYSWDLGDGTKQTVTMPIITHSYSEYGNYTVNLTVTDTGGLNSTDSIWVRVLDITPPSVKIIFNGSSVNEDAPVELRANATDNAGIESVTWKINGVESGNGTKLVHTFAQPGRFAIDVRVVDLSGLSAFDGINITVNDITNPVADPGPSRTRDEDQEIIFNASLSTDNVGIKSYIWNFGDSADNFDGKEIPHVFRDPGIYNVTLNVTDAAGNANSSRIQVTVRDATAPVAEIVVNRTAILKGDSVSFDGTRSTDNVGIVQYRWNFDDGTQATGDKVEHKFRKAGKFNVSIVVTDAQGHSDSRSILINVREPQTAQVNTIALAAIIIVVFIAGIVTVYAYRRLKYGGYRVDEVFLIYNDGRLIKHVTARPDETVDKDILASMLTAVQDFVRDSFRNRQENLGKLEFGKKTKILIESGKLIYLAVVVAGHDPETLRDDIKKTIMKIEKKYSEKLVDWDGAVSIFSDIDRLVLPLLTK